MRFGWSKAGLVLLVTAFVAAQFVPMHRTNPPVDETKTMFAVENPPAEVRRVLVRSCADCHSNQTRWPWYSWLAPASWLIGSDVQGARRKMNFSEWATYSPDRRSHEREEICNEVIDKEMPKKQFSWFHPEAKLTDSEIEAICTWTNGAPSSLE